MISNLGRKIFGVLALSALSVWAILSFDIHLGLDLRGGSRIVYGFDFQKAVQEGQISAQEDPAAVLEQTARIFQKRLDGSGLADIPIYPQGESQLVVELPDMTPEEVGAIKRIVENIGSLQFRIIAAQEDDLDIQSQIDKYRDWTLAHPGEGPAAFNRGAGTADGPREGILWFKLSESVLAEEASGGGSIRVASDLTAVPVRVEDTIRAVDVGSPSSWEFTGADLEFVGRSQDQHGFSAVRFEFQEHRKAAFADFTEDFRQRQMAIILNQEVHSAPVIRGRLPGGGIITGGENGFSTEEVQELITVLRTGSLRILPQLESQDTVGPSLGRDSIRIGIWSATVGGAAVLAFMLLYYWINGVVACLALAFNAFLLVGALFFTQATLTLPGLAGLVLTIGMAVDANILIFERVREERKRGREVPQAYKNGYERAFTTIVDANLTTFLTAVILYYVGTGPVQGFAAVLALGLLTTMFSSLIFSKLLMHWVVFGRKKGLKEVRMMGSLAGNAKFPFIPLRKVAAVLSIGALGLSVWMFGSRAQEMLGIDFAGGSSARIQLEQSTPISEVSNLLPNCTVIQIENQDASAGSESSMSFLVKRKLSPAERASFQAGETASKDFQATFQADLETKLAGRLAATEPFKEITTVGPRVSGEIQQKAIQAILLALMGIIIYMNFRFKEYRYGLAAVAAVFHDVLITLGALALVHSMGWVEVEINLEIIAAFLTIIGYSLNDTIVVFDRVRENLPRRKESFADVINLSINQSLSRTILTSVTTFFVVGVLFWANRPLHNVLEGFSFAMLVGVVVGTYSSMFVASPMLIFLDRWAREKRVEIAKI